MFENDMPAKREFSVLPKPQTIVALVFRMIKYLFLAGSLYLVSLWALSFYTGTWSWSVLSVFSQVQAANSPRVEARSKAGGSAPVDVPVKAAAVAAPGIDPERMDRLSEGICKSYGLVYDGQTCTKPPAYSGAGIRLRATHGELGHAVEKLFDRDEAAKPRELPRTADRMIDESEAQEAPQQQASETWRPQLRIPRLLHEPGEPCAGGGHRDRWGMGCVFTDEEREELRQRRRW
jgi:hypothetical protein